MSRGESINFKITSLLILSLVLLLHSTSATLNGGEEFKLWMPIKYHPYFESYHDVKFIFERKIYPSHCANSSQQNTRDEVSMSGYIECFSTLVDEEELKNFNCEITPYSAPGGSIQISHRKLHSEKRYLGNGIFECKLFPDEPQIYIVKAADQLFNISVAIKPYAFERALELLKEISVNPNDPILSFGMNLYQKMKHKSKQLHIVDNFMEIAKHIHQNDVNIFFVVRNPEETQVLSQIVEKIKIKGAKFYLIVYEKSAEIKFCISRKSLINFIGLKNIIGISREKVDAFGQYLDQSIQAMQAVDPKYFATSDKSSERIVDLFYEDIKYFTYLFPTNNPITVQLPKECKSEYFKIVDQHIKEGSARVDLDEKTLIYEPTLSDKSAINDDYVAIQCTRGFHFVPITINFRKLKTEGTMLNTENVISVTTQVEDHEISMKTYDLTNIFSPLGPPKNQDNETVSPDIKITQSKPIVFTKSDTIDNLCYENFREKSYESGKDVAGFVDIAFDSGLTAKQADHQYYAPQCVLDIYFEDGTLEGAFCMPEAMSANALTFDYNNDQYLDIYLPKLDGSGILYRNDKKGNFEDVTDEVGMTILGASTAGVSADFDNDGDLDIWVGISGRQTGHKFFINHNNGEKFTEEAELRGVAVFNNNSHFSTGAAVGDFDKDGWLDLFVFEWISDYIKALNFTDPQYHSRLFRNLGEKKPGYFEDVTMSSGVDVSKYNSRALFPTVDTGDYGLAAAFVDLDDDGWLDLAVASDFGTSMLYWNRGDGTFYENGFLSGIGREENGMGCTFGDINQDNKMDWFVSSISDTTYSRLDCQNHPICNYGWSGNRMYINQGNRRFLDETDKYGVRKSNWAWGSVFFDYDNDADLDLFIANGFVISGSTTFEDRFNYTPDQLFQNNVNGETMVNVAPELGVDNLDPSKGVAVADFDKDGDVDILVGSSFAPLKLYRNDLNNGNNFLKVKVLNQQNMNLLNTVIRLYVNESSAPQLRHIGISSHYMSQSEAVAHFGLGKATSVHRVEIIFYPSGVAVNLLNPPVNKMLVIKEDIAVKENREVDLSGISVKTCENSVSVEATESDKKMKKKSGEQKSDESKSSSKIEIRTSKDDGYKFLIENPDQPEHYSYDGSGNNVNHPDWGQRGKLLRKFPAFYENKIDSPTGKSRPNARLISSTLFEQHEDVFSSRNLSMLSVNWGQFLVHDISLANSLQSLSEKNNFPIKIPKGDLWFDPDNTGTQMMRFARTTFDGNTGDSEENPRQQVNQVTSYIDASSVYGAKEERANALRTHTGGKLRTSEGGMPPLNEGIQEVENAVGRRGTSLLLGGDHRANEQPGLLSVHTVFVREHNRLADEIVKVHPDWTDEQIFQRARKIIAALIQVVTYQEFLPALLGDRHPVYTGYNDSLRPDTTNEFATVSFRVGHTEIHNTMKITAKNGLKKIIHLRDAFFMPEFVIREGLEPFIMSMIETRAQEIDTKVVSDLRNFLFGSRQIGGMDLIATNIQRARDHGLPDYNSMREFYGLKRYTSFSEITKDEFVSKTLEDLYKNIDDVDPFVGGISEDHVHNSSLGSLFHEMIFVQYNDLCNGDRFFYKNSFTSEEIEEIEKTKLSDIILRNTDIQQLPATTMFVV